MRVRTLGPFSLTVDGAVLEPGAAAQRKPMELLKATVALGIRDVEVAKLLALLWPGAELPAARRSFDTALHRLRRLVPASEWLLLHEGRLSLDPAIVWVDTEAFAKIAERVQRAVGAGDGPALEPAVAALLELYQGDFLARDADRPWALQARDRDRARFVECLAGAGEHFERAQGWLTAEDLYRRGLAVDNLMEPFYRGTIRCLLARGESAEALKLFRRCRELLSIVLNLQPAAETLALVRDIYDVAETTLPLPDKPSIAVLPFANLSTDRGREYFADGVVEDIITALSRFHSLFVIARNSSFAYKDKALDVRIVSKELGVRYVLEGSLRMEQQRIRLTAQLIDAHSGIHLWAENYDRTLESVFALQEELTQRIVMAIAPKVDAAELDKARRRPALLSAYELAVRARAHSLEAYIKSDRSIRQLGIREAKEALAIDPDSVIALNAFARLEWQHLLFDTASDRATAWQDGMTAAMRAIELDPADDQAHANRGLLLTYAQKRDAIDEALVALRRAAEMNPNNVNTLNALGFVEVVVGNPDIAIERLQQALRLSPRDPIQYSLFLVLSIANCSSGHYSRGVEYALLGISDAPRMAMLHLFLALNYVGLGECAKAKEALDTARRVGPEYVKRAIDGNLIYREPAQRLRAETFLRVAAGLEDPSAADTLR